MYPNEFLGLTLYDLCICVGIIACFFVFCNLADKNKIRRRLQNFALICGVVGIGIGFCSAVLFQALYNIERDGGFTVSLNTGATFYGGLLGGATAFLITYFVVGRFVFRDKECPKKFWKVASCASPAIAVAHGFGRLGCLMAGCCHGELTDKWYGLLMFGNKGYAKYVPIQLFEAVFLFVLFFLLFVRSSKGKHYNLQLYMITYGVWRFLIEFARGDYRGTTVTDALTPSQLIACLMISGGVTLFFVERNFASKRDFCGGKENE